MQKLIPIFLNTLKYLCSFLIVVFLATNSLSLIFTNSLLKSTTKINKKKLSNNKKYLPKTNSYPCSIKWLKPFSNLILNTFKNSTILSLPKKFKLKMEKSITVESWFLMLPTPNYSLNKVFLKLQNIKMNSNTSLLHTYLKIIGQ